MAIFDFIDEEEEKKKIENVNYSITNVDVKNPLPWERVRADSSSVSLMPRNLPDTDRYEWAREKMLNWLPQRQEQFNKLAREEFRVKKDYAWPPEKGDFFNSPEDKREDVQEFKDDIFSQAMNRIEEVKYKNPYSIRKGTYREPIAGAYFPGHNYIYFPWKGEATDETVIHETAHATRIGEKYGTAAMIKSVKDQDDLFQEKKGSLRDYDMDPGEIYSEIWEIREQLGLKPGDVATVEMFKNYNSRPKSKLYRYFRKESIVQMLNDLVEAEPEQKKSILDLTQTT